MKYNFFGFCFLVLVSSVLFCDEVVSPTLSPSGFKLPGLASTLVSETQKKYDEKSLQGIAAAMEDALAKTTDKSKESHPKKSGELNKASKSKKEISLKNDVTQESDVLSVMVTEFLRSDEFSHSITLKTSKISIRDALLIIAKQINIKILVDNDIQGFLPSLNADQIPACALVQMILDANKPALVMVNIGGTWRVMTKDHSDATIKTLFQGDLAADRINERIVIKNAIWDDRLKETIKGLWSGVVGDLKKQQETYLVFDDSSSTVLVSGRRSQVKKFKDSILALDVSMPQVRLEMRVICAGKNFESDLGLQWSGLYDRRAWAGKFGLAGFGIGDITPVSSGGAAPAANPLLTLHPINTNNPDQGLFKNLLGWALNAIPANLATKAAAAAVNFPITFGGRNLEWGRINLQLMAAEQNSEIKTILKPTLLVNSNESAEILVGQQLPHKVSIQESVQGSLVNAASTFYKDVGTKLQVKPVAQANAGSIVLEIFLEHSYVTNLQQSALLGATNNRDDRGNYSYVVETARTKNKVLLHSGQTTMIGGLMVNTYEYVEAGIPFLKDIPVLGLLFKGRSKVLAEKQLLIFITPSLVSENREIV